MKGLMFFLLVLFTSSAFGQADLLEKKDRLYLYKGSSYKCKELSPIYSQSPEAFKLYMSGKKKKKRARVFAYVGLGLMSSGVLAILTDDITTEVFGAGGFLLGLVCELIAIAPTIRGSIKFKRALETFNYEMIEKHGYQSETSLVFGVTGNGLGLFFQF